MVEAVSKASRYRWAIPVIATVFVVVVAYIALCWWRPFLPCWCRPVAPVDCASAGGWSLFVADFDEDEVGSLPAPATPLHYGPPGADLEVQGSANTVEVVNSAALGSKAVKIERGAPDVTILAAVVGDIGEGPYTTGVYQLRYRAHGEVVPDHMIAGTAVYVRSTAGGIALGLKLYDGSYYLQEDGSYLQLTGSYDPSIAHLVHIELDLDDRNYSICIDDEVVAANKPLLQEEFGALHSLQYFAPPTITEAFESVYVVDDIRITKRMS